MNRLLSLVDESKSERERLLAKCEDLETKVGAHEARQELLESVAQELKEHIEKLEEEKTNAEQELNGKTESELELLGRVSELQEELSNALEQMKELGGGEETKQGADNDLEREKEALQKQLNESYVQISALKVGISNSALFSLYRGATFSRHFAFQKSLLECETCFFFF